MENVLDLGTGGMCVIVMRSLVLVVRQHLALWYLT